MVAVVAASGETKDRERGRDVRVGVGSVVPAGDGAEAVQLAGELPFDLAVLDLNMPRLDGLAAAHELAALQPTIAIALQSSDPDAWRQRAAGLGFPLFDKGDFDGLLGWAAAEVATPRHAAPVRARRRDLSCVRCGYGIATDPSQRCPMCGTATAWTDAGRARSRRGR